MDRASDQTPFAIVDIDGVVADVGHRLRHLERRPKDWAAFFAAAPLDPVLEPGRALVSRLAADHEVVFLTGRPEHYRPETQAWLEHHGMGGHQLVMRPAGDHRPAARTKLELLGQLADRRHVGLVVDDDPLVAAAMEGAGHQVLLADWADRPRSLFEAQEVDGRS